VFILAALWYDLTQRRIPNFVSYPCICFGLALAGICSIAGSAQTQGDCISFPHSMLGTLVCFILMFVIYSYTNSGAGDVKLAAGIGAFLGVKGGLLAICYAYISAACFAGCLLIWLFGFGFALRGLLRFINVWVTPESPEIDAKAKAIMSRGLPLAPFFLIGTILTLFDLLRFFQAY